MSSLLENKFLERTKIEIDNYEKLKSIFTDMYKNEFDLFKQRRSAFEEMSKIKESDPDLKKLYEEFTETMKSIEDDRNTKILKITSKYIPSFSYNISFAKDYRSRIDFYKYNKKKPVENEDLSKANKDYKPFENIEEDIAIFEQRRLNQYRLLLLHFLHDKLVYHTQSFQKIGEMYKKVRDQLIIEYPQNEINNGENEE